MSKKSSFPYDLELLVLLTLLLGTGIQLGLGQARTERQLRAGDAVFHQALSASDQEGRRLLRLQEEAQERHRAWQQAAYSRLADGARRHREVYDGVSRELLILVNPWNPVPEDYETELSWVSSYDRSFQVDARCAEELMQMLEDCQAAGNHPYICSAHREHAYQEMLFSNKIDRLLGEGVWPSEVREVAAQSVALPGTSEHELGLAVDIIDLYYPYLNQEQEKTETQKWLMENCWKYGFILRYPNGTSDITGIIYEPWHYRYVGPFAQEITQRGITLEEYIQLRRGR